MRTHTCCPPLPPVFSLIQADESAAAHGQVIATAARVMQLARKLLVRSRGGLT